MSENSDANALCVWHLDGSEHCSRPVETRGFPPVDLCEEHAVELSLQRKRATNAIISRLYEEHPDTPHLKGWTYIVRLEDGYVKIGYTGKDSPADRLQDLRRKLGPIEVLALLPGGQTLECILHHRFKHLRVKMFHEKFEPANELLEFAAEHGIHPEAADAALA